MTGIETALMVAGTALSAVGTIAQGSAASRQAQAQAEAAAYNQAVQRAQAETERDQANIEAQLRRREGERLQAAQRARIAGAGVTTEGSPLLVMQDTAAQAEENAIRTIYGGEQRARALEQGAVLSGMEAASAMRAASSAKTGSLLSAGGSLLTAGAKAWGGGASLFAPRGNKGAIGGG